MTEDLAVQQVLLDILDEVGKYKTPEELAEHLKHVIREDDAIETLIKMVFALHAEVVALRKAFIKS